MKSVYAKNVEQKKSRGKWNETPPITPKASLYPKKVILCIMSSFQKTKWLIPSICSKLDQMKASIDEKISELVNRKFIIFHQDNIRPCFLMTRQKLLQLGWEVLTHLLYLPDIAPLDFHLFWSLHNSLNKRTFKSIEDYKRSFGKMELWSCLQSGRGNGAEWWTHCPIKFLMKMETMRQQANMLYWRMKGL